MKKILIHFLSLVFSTTVFTHYSSCFEAKAVTDNHENSAVSTSTSMQNDTQKEQLSTQKQGMLKRMFVTIAPYLKDNPILSVALVISIALLTLIGLVELGGNMCYVLGIINSALYHERKVTSSLQSFKKDTIIEKIGDNSLLIMLWFLIIMFIPGLPVFTPLVALLKGDKNDGFYAKLDAYMFASGILQGGRYAPNDPKIAAFMAILFQVIIFFPPLIICASSLASSITIDAIIAAIKNKNHTNDKNLVFMIIEKRLKPLWHKMFYRSHVATQAKVTAV